MKYRISGAIRITYTWWVDETIEAETEEDAIKQLSEELRPEEAFETEIADVIDLSIIEAPEDALHENHRR